MAGTFVVKLACVVVNPWVFNWWEVGLWSDLTEKYYGKLL